MEVLKVTTRLTKNDIWQCRTSTPLLSEIVVSQGNSPLSAQTLAARFLDTNFPGEFVEWEDGYHGFDTALPAGQTHFMNWSEW